jgi:transcriptional regulator GlxA family with amidase domain
LVKEDLGPALALAVARELVVYLKRAGGQKQYSEPLAFQTGSRDHLADLGAWMLDHLGDDLSVSRLAQYCCLSTRQVNRRFKRAFGVAPATYVERLRVEEARNRLSSGRAQFDQVAHAVGFRSADVFRRAFERHFGIAPAQYRARFSATRNTD